MGFIYIITNKITQKIYIGKNTYCKDLKSLIDRYRSELKYSKTNTNRYIIRSMRHYGMDNFQFDIVEDGIMDGDINDRERYYIQLLKSNDVHNGYNLTVGGDGVNGLKWRQESRDLMSRIKKGLNAGEKNYFFGKTHTVESRVKIIESNKRRKGGHHRLLTDEEKKVLSDSHKGQVAWNKGKEYFQIKGDKNPNYRFVDKEKLIKLILSDHSYKEICNILNISITCFYSKLKEFDLRYLYDEHRKKNSIYSTD